MNPSNPQLLHLGDCPVPTAMLWHEMPDGTHHIDWFIGTDVAGTQPLITFRCDRRLDELEPGASAALERLPDHRAIYLRYEGDISGGRGHVRRLRSGRVIKVSQSQRQALLQVLWEGGEDEEPQFLTILQSDLHRWLVFCGSMDRKSG